MTTKEIIDIIHALCASSVSQLHYKKDGTELFLDKNTLDKNTKNNHGESYVQKDVIKEREEEEETEQSQPNEYYEQTEPILNNTSNTIDSIESITEVRSPIVGIYHEKSENPLEVGQQIKKGDILCVIEAMNVLNNITAPKDCIIHNIFAIDGELVEYGQILMEFVDV